MAPRLDPTITDILRAMAPAPTTTPDVARALRMKAIDARDAIESLIESGFVARRDQHIGVTARGKALVPPKLESTDLPEARGQQIPTASEQARQLLAAGNTMAQIAERLAVPLEWVARVRQRRAA
jgi:hypothetical protein